jgi:hypothetical protein
MFPEYVCIPVSMIYLHLVENIGLNNFLLRWVPHMLTSELRRDSCSGFLKENKKSTSMIS